MRAGTSPWSVATMRPAGPAHVQVRREHSVDLDAHFTDDRRRTCQEVREGHAVERGPTGRHKTSADSISILPPLLGRDAVAIFPSGLPVLKKKGVAAAGVAVRRPNTTA